MENTFDSARDLFRNKDYPQALDLMAQVPDTMRNDAFYFEYGILLLINDQVDAAKANIARSNLSYRGEKQWYLALASIKAGDKAVGMALLQEIAQSASPRKEAALELLNALD